MLVWLARWSAPSTRRSSLSRRKVGSVAEALGMLGFGRIFDLVVSELLKKSIGGAGSQRLDRYWDSAAGNCRHMRGAFRSFSRY